MQAPEGQADGGLQPPFLLHGQRLRGLPGLLLLRREILLDLGVEIRARRGRCAQGCELMKNVGLPFGNGREQRALVRPQGALRQSHSRRLRNKCLRRIELLHRLAQKPQIRWPMVAPPLPLSYPGQAKMTIGALGKEPVLKARHALRERLAGIVPWRSAAAHIFCEVTGTAPKVSKRCYVAQGIHSIILMSVLREERVGQELASGRQ
mmetsp:Transcript_15416/g.42351  ORF Transcript_15416/g.42351 Transcript_15416/m.42351 type:complete len:207 (+) Transcript_15416:1470-2090(+)